MNDWINLIFDTMSRIHNSASIMIKVIFILFLILLIVSIVIYVVEIKKNKSARTTFVPFDSNALKEDLPVPEKNTRGQCIYCGEEITPGSQYCNHCGKKQTKRYTKIFTRQNMSNAEFINMINTWLASNNRIANVECQMVTHSRYGILTNKYILDSVTLRFELFRNPNEKQYALTEISKFALIETSTKKLLEEWKLHNPTAKIIETAGGTTMRGKAGMELTKGLGANNNSQIFVFFKIPRK